VKPHPTTEHEIYGQTAEKRAGAFFFLVKPESRSLIELARLAGMPETHHLKLADEPGAEVVVGSWAGLSSVGRLREYPKHVCLEIYFSQMAVIGLYDGIDRKRDLPLEQDPALPLAYTFRDACLRLQPEVALITTSSVIARTDVMGDEIYPQVLSWDAYGLSIDASLLYVNEDLKYNLWDMPPIDERDKLPIERGMIVFGGKGNKRW
jgi:hypothetical protein